MKFTSIERLNDEKERRWGERLQKVPYLAFPPSWQVAIIPPIGGADARFKVKCGDANVSVYLDFDSRLGHHPSGPYWEVYPHQGDIYRCDMGSVEELMGIIGESIKEQCDNP